MWKMFFAIAICALPARAADVRFTYPKWQGYALDWCATFENNCGQGAADMFCKKKGYLQVSDFRISSRSPDPTISIGDGKICDPHTHGCDTFRYIDCREATIRYYSAPMWHGYRLDWCLQFSAQCGAPAAEAFCKANGYGRAGSFIREGPLNVQTMTIGSSEICSPARGRCDGFATIECDR